MERIRLLLLELVVERLKASLRRLLFCAARAKLCLRTGEASRLRARSELTKLRASLTKALKVCLLRSEADALLLLRRGHSLIIGLLVNRAHGLSGSKILLPREVSRDEARAVAAKGARRLGVHQIGLFNALLLL